jgi:hypothetical protein
LEREVGPLADTVIATKPLPRTVIQRAVIPTGIAAAVLFLFMIVGQHLWSDAQSVAETTGLSTSVEADEISRLRVELARAEAAQRSLQDELDVAKNQIRRLGKAHSWFENTAMLTYRSPWPPR